MRIVVDPPSVRDAASGLRTAAGELESTAASLRGAGLPSMPGWLAGEVLGALGTVVPTLLGVAGEYRTLAGDLDGRVDRAEVMSDYEVFLRAFAITGSPFAVDDVVQNGASVLRLLRGLHSGSLARIAAAESAVAAAEAQRGAADLSTLNAWFRWQERVSRFVPLRSGEQAAELFDKPSELLRAGIPGLEATRAGTVLRVGGRAFGVLGIGVNAVVAIHGSPYEGARGTVDRVVSGAGALGGIAAFTPLAATPPGAIVVGLVIGGTGAWVVGNLVYDYRHEIAHAFVSGARDLWRARNVIADATIPGYVFWDQRHELAHLATSGEHLVESGVHELASTGSAVGHGVEHGVSTGFHAVTHFLGL